MRPHTPAGAGLAGAFTLLEVMMVVIIIGILAAVVAPKFTGLTDEARTAATESMLGGVRSAIASFRSAAVIDGTDPYPTLAQLQASGVVLRSALPANPFTGVGDIQSASAGQAAARTVFNATGAGWNYFYDNTSDPPTAVFYANTDTGTTASDGGGGTLTANEL